MKQNLNSSTLQGLLHYIIIRNVRQGNYLKCIVLEHNMLMKNTENYAAGDYPVLIKMLNLIVLALKRFLFHRRY